MEINRYIKEAHDYFVSAGEYDCPECGGLGRIDSEPLKGVGRMIQMTKECPSCGGLKINPNKNIGELLMLIVSELGEALKAHRGGRFADWDNYNIKYPISKYDKTERFEKYIKDTFEDKIADVFIRIFDFCAYVGFEIGKLHPELIFHKITNLGEMLMVVVGNISCIKRGDYLPIVFCFNFLLKMCNDMNIPIEKHIEAKIFYMRGKA